MVLERDHSSSCYQSCLLSSIGIRSICYDCGQTAEVNFAQSLQSRRTMPDRTPCASNLPYWHDFVILLALALQSFYPVNLAKVMPLRSHIIVLYASSNCRLCRESRSTPLSVTSTEWPSVIARPVVLSTKIICKKKTWLRHIKSVLPS